MLVRFVVLAVDPVSMEGTGLFQAVYQLLDCDLLARHDEAVAREALGWFNRNLLRPRRFSRSRRPAATNRAICWFRPTAFRCLTRMGTLATILEENGHATARMTTRRPGYVVYEDDPQVVAERFRGRTRGPASSHRSR